MARLPNPGGDDNAWGTILNDFLSQAHKSDGTLKDGSISTDALQAGTVTDVKLSGDIQASLGNADTAVQSVNSKTGTSITLNSADIGAAAVSHTHTTSDVTNLQAGIAAMNGLFVVKQNGDLSWPARPANVPNTVPILWIGESTPPIGGAGMIDNVDIALIG